MKDIIPGQTISHYRITEKLGEGGMGVVYKAEDIKLERTVALKFLPPHLSNQEEEKRRFIHEAKAASALEHNNICTIHEIDETKDGQLFIVMSFLEGKTLREKIDASPIKVDEAIGIAIQVAEGLKLAHEKGIVHRDMKPANIMVTTDNTVKIMDFGLAKLVGKTKLTQKGATLGTFSYMSPEQSRGEEVDYRTDIWSLGVVLYEMLTGQLPFKGEYEQAVVYSLMNEQPEPITSLRSNVPLELERIVNKTLAKEPDERYQHIDELIADLKIERKNLEYARLGYNNTSTINRISKEKSAGIKIPKQRAKLKIIILSAVLVLLVAAFFILNPFNLWVGKNPSSESTGKSLAVMYFENIPDPEDKNHTGEMLTNLLITSLSQVKGLEVISRERLLDIQKDLGLTDTKILSPSLASQVAKRTGVTEMLIGSILQENPKLAITTRLINVKSGKIISSQQLTNFSGNQIFNLVDSLSYLLRNSFQISSTVFTEIKSISNVTTNSTEAYRAYIEGIELYNRLNTKEASAAFIQATELDSTFAMAYFYLSVMQGLLWENQESLESANKAVELIDHTTERERLQILARNYELQNNPFKEEEVLEQLIEKYPHEIQAYLSLGLYLYTYQMLNLKKGIEIINQGLKITPSAKHLWNQLAYSYAYLNNRQKAIYAINKYIDLAPAEPNPYDTKGDIYGYFMEYDSSLSAFQKSFSLQRDFSAERLGENAILRCKYKDAKQYFEISGIDLPLIEIHQGRLYAAQKKLDELLKTETSRSERLKILYIMMHIYYESGQYSKMLFIAKKFFGKVQNNLFQNSYDRIYFAWALVKNNESARAHRVLLDLQRDVAEGALSLQVAKDYLSAIISFEERNDILALHKFEGIFEQLPPNHWPSIYFAITLLRNGQIPAAILELQRILYRQPSGEPLLGSIPGGSDYWPIPAVKAHYWLGVAYEQQGKKDKAHKEYEEFLDIWKDADFKSPEIKDAKIRVSKLKGVAIK